MKPVFRIAALLCAAVFALSGCGSMGFDESFVFPEAGANYLSDERVEEGETLGVGKKPSKMISMTSAELVSTIRIGWNIGKSLDVCCGDFDGNWHVDAKPEEGESVSETLWGNPLVTRELFKGLTDSGINAVRIPVTWRDHTDEEGNIDPEWLNRVQQVVNYAYNCGLYVIINMQHDGAKDTDFGAWIPNAATDYDTVVKRFRRIWEQVAERFENYNERLLFESMNEVKFPCNDVSRAFELQNALNAEFVDVIRAGGGNNPRRHIIIAGVEGKIQKTLDERFVVPNDPAARIIVSVHSYFARNALMGSSLYEWGTEEQKAKLAELVSALKTRFVDKGIPVIIDECGTEKTTDEGDVTYCRTLLELCRENGMACFVWDDGRRYDRENYVWDNPELISALNDVALN